METKVLMSVEEYLRSSFDDGDREFVDGELVERHMGAHAHSILIGVLYRLLLVLQAQLGIRIRLDIRMPVTATRYRVPDLAVWRHGNLGLGVSSIPPFLAVEVLSPEDRMVRVQPKVREYLRSGTEFVWVVDPLERQALVYTQDDPGGQPADVLWTRNPDIEIPLVEVFRLFDEDA